MKELDNYAPTNNNNNNKDIDETPFSCHKNIKDFPVRCDKAIPKFLGNSQLWKNFYSSSFEGKNDIRIIEKETVYSTHKILSII